jgi:outer membrane beta-barrel protein
MITNENSQISWQNSFARVVKEWGVGIFFALFSVFWLMLIASTWAEAKEVESEDSEYNFSWLDPDKKIYVLQNRKYTKAGHPMVSLMGGVGASNPYRSTFSVDPRLAYYINEMFGIEAFFTYTSNSPNNTIEALQIASPTTLPNIREIRAMMGAMVHFVPWYAKINVFNTILYFDWYFGAGASQVQSFVDTRTNKNSPSNFVQQNIPALVLSTGHLYHISQRFLARFDLTGSFYQAPINGLAGDNTWYSNFNFSFGLGLKI